MTPGERRQAAMAFYDLMFNECRPREAIEQYVGDEYIQHKLGLYESPRRGHGTGNVPQQT